MASYRVIKRGSLYYVQKKCGILFTKWRFLNKDKRPITHGDYEGDGTPISFDYESYAVDFMRDAHTPSRAKPTAYTVIAWIGDKE